MSQYSRPPATNALCMSARRVVDLIDLRGRVAPAELICIVTALTPRGAGAGARGVAGEIRFRLHLAALATGELGHVELEHSLNQSSCK